MPPQLITMGMPLPIIFIIISQQVLNISMLMPEAGIILQVMPSPVISQLILAIIMGIIPIVPIIPPIGMVMGIIPIPPIGIEPIMGIIPIPLIGIICIAGIIVVFSICKVEIMRLNLVRTQKFSEKGKAPPTLIET
jgi:hypothetical protein